MKVYILVTVLSVVSAQQYTTPVPILKQINKHNEDGSYSYGYEAADGTYKIETKYPNGEVFGKYGYVDDNGKVRTVEYGASRRGFEPAGNEIQVPPPTLKSDFNAQRPLGQNEEDDGQYREDPSVYYKNDANNVNPPPRYQQPQYQPRYQPQYQQPQYQQPQYQQPQYQQPQPAFRPQTNFNYNPQPTPRPTQYSNPAYPNYNAFQGHPASNVDIWSGSYSVNYRR